MKIAWIGVGVMGAPMAINARRNGHRVIAYNRTLSKAEALKKYDIQLATSIEQAIQDVDVIVTMLGYPDEVEDVYMNHIFKSNIQNKYLIDMSTSSPRLAQQIYHNAKKTNNYALDAPVSGGEIGAQDANLTIMVGGDKDVFYKMLPIFKCFGKSINYIGESGSGQHCKMCNQIAIAGTLAGVAEAITYARLSNLDIHAMLEAIQNGAAGSWQLQNTAIKMVEQDFAPAFYSKHFLKDMKIAQELVQNDTHRLPVLDEVCSIFKQLEKDSSFSQEATQAIIKWYNRR